MSSFERIRAPVRRLLGEELFARVSGRMAVRQLVELRTQIVSLYALLSVNACALAFTHLGLAPASLTLACPAVFVALCAARALHWWRMRPETFSEARAERHLRLTTALSLVFAVGFVGWAIALSAFGGPYEQGHVAIFIAITVIGCIFCLTHLPVAAFGVTLIVTGAFLIHCLTSHNGVFIAIALNTTFVTVVMVRILANNFRAFVTLTRAQFEAQRLAEENARLALSDSLTGLPNRRAFFSELEALTEGEAPFALAIFDLDRFKPINDTYGHKAGDRVLQETGRRLARFADSGVSVARLGGDEFGALIRLPADGADVTAVCDRICAALRAPIRLGETLVTAGCSAGLAVYPEAGRGAPELFDRADYALYHSKLNRRGHTTAFSQEHENAIRTERAIEAALHSPDLAREIEVQVQPILDLRTNRVVMVEGLARWTHPTLGRIAPDRFIAAAERCGAIHRLTTTLLRRALSDAARLPPGIGLSFNLSSHDLASAETVIAIMEIVRESGFDPRRLTLELTETALMRDFERACDAITLLRALGIRIALDDFGTGYSSLSYVHRLPLDKVKIDRSFMADLHAPRGERIVATILDFCRNLDLPCIVEGVETEGQLAILRRLGCRSVQGYLIGRPMRMTALLQRLPEIEAGAAEERPAPRLIA
ncbi:putative bifunctional diguanylate cyclase/phosphodiesterase [Methylorubrum subtropicum]|uniref:putative bifunctional diguanylate cyclase/phosphodiesterase n=1 Tax=Methylorubrum subtropicum TaxID=3138812 RepID=UPI00399C9991